MSSMKDLFEDIKIFLPKYLSDEDSKKLFDDIKRFPSNLDDRFYSSYLKDEDIIFQGDGLKSMTVTNLPQTDFFQSPVMVFSNTCDTDEENDRLFSANLSYAPIFSLENYRKGILKEGIKSEEAIRDHINDIKRQRITQIFYLPKGSNLPEDCIVFFDRIIHCDNKSIVRKGISSKKVFILSNYGFYLFLIKLSIHFTRIQEKVDRK